VSDGYQRIYFITASLVLMGQGTNQRNEYMNGLIVRC